MDLQGELLRLRFGPEDWQYIEVAPNVTVETLSDRDALITIKGVYRLQGNSPETFRLERLV